MRVLDRYYKAIGEYREARDSIIDHWLLSEIYDQLMFDLEGSWGCTDVDDEEEMKIEIARLRSNTKAILKAKELIDSIEIKFA